MRYQRLILEAGANAVTLRFHPRLTVVAGLGRAEREGLVSELLGAMAGGRGGAHLEVIDDHGRRLAIIRPANREDRVIESDSGRDVTEEFTTGSGSVDLLHALGLNAETARRRSRLSSTDVAAVSRSDALVSTLAAVDQRRLWAAADRVQAADARLKAEAHSAGAAPEDAPLIEDIEARHAEFEDAQRRHERVRHRATVGGATAAVAAVPAAVTDVVLALPLVSFTVLSTLAAIVSRRRMVRAATREQAVLEAAGARSYIGFHLQRVNGLVAAGTPRDRLTTASLEHRQALAEWRALAGEVPVEWAVTMRDRIVAAARRVDEAAGPAAAAPPPALADVDPTDLAHAFVARLSDLRHACPDGESMPLILDEPLSGVAPSVKQWMLELVGRSAGSPQVIYLTADEDVAAWARIEAVSGELHVIEPSPHEEDAMHGVVDLG